MWTINVVYLVVQTTILNFCVKKSVFFTHISEYIFVLKSVIVLKYICNVKLQVVLQKSSKYSEKIQNKQQRVL